MNQLVETLDPKDIAGLQRFFQTYGHLSTNDQAQIANVSTKTIGRLRRKAGIGPKPTTARPPRKRTNTPSLPTVTAPPNWRHDLVWLKKMVQVYNVCQLARIVGLSRSTLSPILKRHKIKCKTLKEATRSKNKCCTHAWCYEHYIIHGLSQQKCADLAGIRQQTFSGWLNRFKIPVRDNEQAHTGRKGITLWEKDLIAKLRQQDVVRRVFVRDGYIHVRYKNYFWENYYTRAIPHPKRPYTYFQITRDNSQIKKVPLVYPEYGVDLEGKPLHPAHICLSRADLDTASMVEKRLAIHEYARQITSRGWVWPSYPETTLQEDFARVENFDPAKYLENGGFTAIPKGLTSPPGRKLMMHFFDFSQFWNILSRPKMVVRFLNTLERRTVKFNLFNLLLTVAANEDLVIRRQSAPNIPDPVVYAAIFRRLKLQGTMLDINVGLGNRAVAAAVSGLKYTTADPSFNFALERGFQHFTGLEYTPYDGQQVDVALYDEGFRIPDMQKVLPYLNSAKKLMVFCPHTHAQEVLKYKPQTAIRLRTRLYQKTPNYLFVW